MSVWILTDICLFSPSLSLSLTLCVSFFLGLLSFSLVGLPDLFIVIVVVVGLSYHASESNLISSSDSLQSVCVTACLCASLSEQAGELVSEH